MPELPVDVIVEILCRLPVKSLLRFRCLSRQFRSIIDSRDFINRHLQNHSVDQRLIVHGNLSRNVSDLFSVDFDSANNGLKLEHPFESWGDEYTLIGSCNGLLALSHRRGTSVGLWNISTTKHQILPQFWTSFKLPLSNPNFFGYFFDGFGYDVTSDDHKWVRVIHFDGKNCTETTVCSLKTNSWRRIEDLPPYYNYSVTDIGVLVGGALNWVVQLRDVADEDSKWRVLSFDLKGEKFCQVSVPDLPDNVHLLEVVVFGGSLCLGSFYSFKEALGVWVMQEYGVKESWTKLFSFKEETPLGSVFYCNGIKALVYSKCDDQVLFYGMNGKVFWYDLEKEVDKSIEINEWPTLIFRAAIYVESLVSPVVNMLLDGYVEKRKWENASEKNGCNCLGSK